MENEEEKFTCEICIEPVTLPNTKFKNSDRCAHSFCTDCIIKYIQVKLEDNVSTIQCPATNCNQSLEPLSCCPIIGHQLFSKWCDKLCESTVLKVDGVYCPNKECSVLILNECKERNLQRCVCHYCKKPFCFTCKVSWHAGFSCDETIHEDDVSFGILCQAEGWKMCPTCGHCIERIAGCQFVTCRCGTKFCYKSGSRSRLVPGRGLFLFLCIFFILAIIFYLYMYDREFVS